MDGRKKMGFNSNKKKKSWFTIWIGFITLLVIAFLFISMSFIHNMNQMSHRMYEHPYTVSNEARSMRTRLLDMRLFIQTVLIDDETESASFLAERYQLQEDSIAIISERYLGPTEDIDRLNESMQALKDIQTEAVLNENIYTKEEMTVFIEEKVNPCYDEVNDCLLAIIRFADGRVMDLEKEVAQAATQTIVLFFSLLAFIVGFSIYFWYREKKNMKEIEYREMLFDGLSRNIDDIIYIYNVKQKKTEFISANEQRVLGFVPNMKNIEGEGYLAYLPKEEQLKLDAMISAGEIRETQIFDFKLPVQGIDKYMRVRIYPEMHNNKVIRYIIFLSDQTKENTIQQNLQDALMNAQQANAAKSQFLSRMSHEIRTPMNAIIGMTSIAAAYIDNRDKVENCLSKIGFASKHLMSLINDVLDMSKIEEGKMNIAHERFHLNELIETVSTIVYPQAEEKGVAFKVPILGVTEEHLLGDPLRLRQILFNLLSNALKFTPCGGEICLKVQQIKNNNGKVRFRFTISDTGIGMSEAFMSRIFKPFEQEDVKTTQTFGGTGLGLSITHNLVSLMGGTIHVKSQPNVGSDFIIELNFDTAQNEERHAPLPHEFEKLKILIADDDQDTCEHTSLLLEKMGINASWVLSGIQAVTAVLSAHECGEDYDVCFIDLKMPDIDGIETVKRIRQAIGPDTLIVIMTAYDWSVIESEARAAGVDYFLSKPLFASTLYNTLLSITQVEYTLPLQKATEKITEDLSGVHLLLAEDNELNREIAVEILQMMGICVDCVENGKMAVEKFESSDIQQYDAVLMDIQMPIMNGYEAAKAIRSCGHPNAKKIPILAMTANAFQEDVAEALASGMNAHIAKPIDPNTLYQVLLKQLKQSH